MSKVNLQNNSKRLITLNNKIEGKAVKYQLLPAGPAMAVDKETASLRFTKQLIKDSDLIQVGAPSGDDLDLDDDNGGSGEGAGDEGGSDDGETLEGLQAEYKEVTGKAADNRWSMETLKEKIEEALDA